MLLVSLTEAPEVNERHVIRGANSNRSHSLPLVLLFLPELYDLTGADALEADKTVTSHIFLHERAFIQPEREDIASSEANNTIRHYKQLMTI